MFLEGGTRDHFLRWLSDEFPHLVDGYQQLYERKYAPSAYRKEVFTVFEALRRKYGIGVREKKNEYARTNEVGRVHEQAMLEWTA
jgi:hypothetical protein